MANCPAPVLIAGGPKMKTAQDTRQVVYEAMQAGAAGIVFGRNIWQSGHTVGMIAALSGKEVMRAKRCRRLSIIMEKVG